MIRENIDVQLQPKQGIKIDSSKKYLFDPTLIQGYVDLTKDYSDKAMQSEANAKASEMNAELSAEQAKASEDNAKLSENRAIEAETKARTSEVNAKASENKSIQEANASAESAYQSQQSALASYQYASNAEEDAKNSLETLGHILESEERTREYSEIAQEKADEASQFTLECQYIKNSLGTVYTFRGSVATVSALPSGASIGDVYDVKDSGINYAWTGTEWDSLGLDVDLSNYALKSDLNSKQDKLVSGTNIKTVNGESVLGSGNILIKTAPDIDNKTITQNSSSQLQAIGVIDQRTSSVVKTWTGTKAQYDALSTKDSNTLYNITDDESNIVNTINDLINTNKNLLNSAYPVGSVYLSTTSTCPLASLISGSTWQQLGTSIITSVNTNVPVKGNGKTITLTNGTSEGGLTIVGNSNVLQPYTGLVGTNVGTARSGSLVTGDKSFGITTDANKSGIVGTVTRTSISVYIFKRTA